MRDRDIKYVVIAVLTVFWFAAFVMILECFDNQRLETMRIADELEKTRTELTEELERQRKELSVNNAICDALVTGKWE